MTFKCPPPNFLRRFSQCKPGTWRLASSSSPIDFIIKCLLSTSLGLLLQMREESDNQEQCYEHPTQCGWCKFDALLREHSLSKATETLIKDQLVRLARTSNEFKNYFRDFHTDDKVDHYRVCLNTKLVKSW